MGIFSPKTTSTSSLSTTLLRLSRKMVTTPTFIQIETIIFSTEIQKETMLFFRKKQIMMVTNTHVYILDKNKKYLKKRDEIK